MDLLKSVLVCLVLLLSHQDGQAGEVGEAEEVVDYQPEQIHLAYGSTVRDIVVTWSTKSIDEKINSSVVKYSLSDGSKRPSYWVNGESKLFVDGGSLNNSWFIHRALLNELKPGRRYEYHVGSAHGWSATYWFRTPPQDLSTWVPHLAVYGDMGSTNAMSLPRLQEETMNGMYDAILHVGDFAYNFETNNGTVGDTFMRQIEPVAAYVPYMVCPGNHEEAYNFSHYRNRFNMPGPYENLFYSIDIGPMHLVSFTTEVFYQNNPDLKPVEDTQYNWMVEDLAEANKPDARNLQPWIVAMGHRPMYCSNGDDPGFCVDDNPIRKGVTEGQNLENLFYREKVDVEIWAHEHSYERLWPVFNLTVYNGSESEPYVNPKAPVHLITGSAGCVEEVDNFTIAQPPWSAFRSSDYGYTRLMLFNKTHMRFQQVSVEQDKIVDEWWVVRNFPRERYPLYV